MNSYQERESSDRMVETLFSFYYTKEMPPISLRYWVIPITHKTGKSLFIELLEPLRHCTQSWLAGKVIQIALINERVEWFKM